MEEGAKDRNDKGSSDLVAPIVPLPISLLPCMGREQNVIGKARP